MGFNKMGRNVGVFFFFHILGGLYDLYNFLEGQLLRTTTMKKYPLFLGVGSVVPPA